MLKIHHSVYSKLFVCLCLLSCLTVLSCQKPQESDEKSQPPAEVDNAVKESDLTTVTLSPQAEERLGVLTSQAEFRQMPGGLSLGGEIVAVPGREVRIAAPASAIVLPPEEGQAVSAGQFVKKGQPVLRLLLMPPERDVLGAREDLVVKQEQYEVALAKANRAEQLLAAKAVSEKSYEEAQVEKTRALAAFHGAKARLNLLEGKDIQEASESLSTLVLESPLEGVLQRIFVSPGQTVPGSADLFEIAGVNPVWVRVPVYVGDLAAINVEKGAVIGQFGGQGSPRIFRASPVSGPPLSDPSSASSDLYFEIKNPERIFRIGQKVSVSLEKKSPKNTLTVPWSAILYDYNGGTWVYVKKAPFTYSRSRVEMSHIIDGYAVLLRGLRPGDEVVVKGAAEIFGTEFGVGK